MVGVHRAGLVDFSGLGTKASLGLALSLGDFFSFSLGIRIWIYGIGMDGWIDGWMDGFIC